ncbi:flagellar hook-associated protein FlgL [Natronospora cellulosivora (SeqCode)]
MRVTTGVINDNFMRNLHNNMKRLDEYNQQLSSGKKFTRPSQNPIGVTTSMGMRNVINANEQYSRNVGMAREWLYNTETVLINQGDILHRVKEQTVYAANESLSQTDRDAIAGEIAELRDEMINLANTKIGDRYLMAGKTTKIADGEEVPFLIRDGDDHVTFNGDNEEIVREIGAGIRIPININGEDNFANTIDTLTALEKVIRTNEEVTVGDLTIENISDGMKVVDEMMDNNLRERAGLGARTNRLELTANRLDEEKLQAIELLSNNEDVDIADAITQLKMQEAVYRASLSIGARIMQPTLVDFLR